MVDSEKGPPDYTENQAISEKVEQKLQEFFKLSDSVYDLIQAKKQNEEEISKISKEISKINENLERIGSEVYLDLYPDDKDANLPVTKKIELIHAANISQKFKKRTTANQLTKAIKDTTEHFKTTTSYTEKSSTGNTNSKSTLSTEKAEEFEDIKEQFYIG